jgi:hypothetical protein
MSDHAHHTILKYISVNIFRDYKENIWRSRRPDHAFSPFFASTPVHCAYQRLCISFLFDCQFTSVTHFPIASFTSVTHCLSDPRRSGEKSVGVRWLPASLQLFGAVIRTIMVVL